MRPVELREGFERAREVNPFLTQENYDRINLLHWGLAYEGRASFPDPFTRIELFYTPKGVTSFPLMTFWRPESPYRLVSGEREGHWLLLYINEFVAEVDDIEARESNLKRVEPFYFFVREVNGDLVLKLNPIQLCDFYQNSFGEMPCGFCFRNDMVNRFRNVSAKDLVQLIWKQEKKDDYAQMKLVDEISIVTGSYTSDQLYLDEVRTLVQGVLPLVGDTTRVVVGSHEGKGATMYAALQKAGVTVFAFPVESMDDAVRQREMKNRKGMVGIDEIEVHIKEAHAVFGDDGVIVRLVAGMGDVLDGRFRDRVKRLAELGDKGIWWNVNMYMPFTHYHWRKFKQHPPYDLEYMYRFCSIINENVPLERQIRFKVSP